MSTLAAGSSTTVALAAGSTLTVFGPGTAQVLPPALPSALLDASRSITLGPFQSACNVALVAVGALTYTLSPTPGASGASTSTGSIGEWWNFAPSLGQNHLAGKACSILLANNGSLTFGASATVTVTIAAPGVFTDTAHGMNANDPIVLSTTGALPTGLVAGTTYYLVSVTVNGYSLAAAPNGTAITTSGTQSGTHTRKSLPKVVPGVNFNGSGFLQSDITVQTAIQKAFLRLDTLTTADMIVAYTVLQHGTSLGGTGTLFFAGRSGDQGWGLQFFGGANLCKARFYHVPKGGSQDQTNINQSFSLVGDVAPFNTMSAVAMTITRAPSNGDMGNMGRGGGLFQVELAMAGLTDQGQFGQQNSAVWHVARIPSGTAPCDMAGSNTGLTIGARPTTAPGTALDPMPSGTGIFQFGIQRRPRQQGFAQMIVRQLADQYRQNPTVQVQPPCTIL